MSIDTSKSKTLGQKKGREGVTFGIMFTSFSLERVASKQGNRTLFLNPSVPVLTQSSSYNGISKITISTSTSPNFM